MSRNKKRLDLIRLLAIFTVLLGIAYFHLNIFAPQLIPKSLRIGMIRKPINILILGTDLTFDSTTHKPMPEKDGRTDTILLTRINPITGQVNVLSIPRDTYVMLPGIGNRKINAANAFGGIKLVKETIYQLTQQPIDYYVVIKPPAVTKMVDILGGVTLDVEKDMRYWDRAQGLDIDLKKGLQKLSGKQAHDYIRFRHDTFGDIGRIGRQQKFLKALSKTLTSPSNAVKAPFAIHTALQEIKTNLPLPMTIRLLNWSRTLDVANLKSVMLPGEV
ncbi:MAG: LCP family protein, partial [Candidatus Margulisbacteria bacterium]|nr:LCP family protein [Candidatus Margulisiibacteriota bacterium]